YIKKNRENEDLIFSTTYSSEETVLYLNVKSMIRHGNDIFSEITNPKYKLIMLDEIQCLDNWSDLLQSAIDMNNKAKFIVSGSNYQALFKEVMVNRIKTFFIQPLSFIDFKNIWNNDSIEEYLKYGSFPKSDEDVSLPIFYDELIEQNIIDKIIVDDFQNKIDGSKFKTITKKINNFVGNEMNLSNFESEVKISRQTIAEYIPKMINSRLVHTVRKFNDSNIKNKYKIYYEDKSMLYYFNDFNNLNNNLVGSLIENTIFNYLSFKYNNRYSLKNSIEYFRDNKDREIDFVIFDQKLLVECKYCNEIDLNEVTQNMNEYIPTDFKDFKKILVVKNEVLGNDFVNGWNIVSLENILRGNYGL
ncbi:MAG: ATP-binding protein, partial [Mycoplasma sp.]